MMINRNISLKELNSFNIDVSAKFFTEIYSVEQLQNVLNEKEIIPLKKMILGGGSNILFTKNFDGIIIKDSISGIQIIDQDSESAIVEAGTGVVWDDLVKYCVEKGFGGIENLSLIPGNVGAAPIQNIGAYGQELKDSFYELSGMYLNSCNAKVFNKAECDFYYRDSIFKNSLLSKFVITSVKLKLSKYPALNLSYKPVEEEILKRKIKNPSIADLRNIIIDIRKSKLPDPKMLGNAGSFFKNPAVTIKKYEELKKRYPDIKHFPTNGNMVKIAAAWLIEKCGWKGKRIGDAGVYQNHSLVLINYGKARGDEILSLANEIRSSVNNEFGIILKNEVNII